MQWFVRIIWKTWPCKIEPSTILSANAQLSVCVHLRGTWPSAEPELFIKPQWDRWVPDELHLYLHTGAAHLMTATAGSSGTIQSESAVFSVTQAIEWAASQHCVTITFTSGIQNIYMKKTKKLSLCPFVCLCNLLCVSGFHTFDLPLRSFYFCKKYRLWMSVNGNSLNFTWY